ncbi:MAG: FtsQ-type POTRA domain-containing protein [Spirochaetales bacterium]|nr:FtsQ-type POTRA domain-containing protein [Spirochaetales bacterium]
MQQIYPINTTWNREKKEKFTNKILWIIIFFLFSIAVIEVLFQFVIAPQLKIKKVIIDSDLSLSREEILHLAGIGKTLYYFSLDTKEIEQKLSEYPAVRNVKAEKRFPGTLEVVVNKRAPLVIALFEDRGRSFPGLIDEEGIVFYIGKSGDEFNLPVISGLDFEEYRAGMKLPDVLRSFLFELNTLRKESSTLFNFISEIKVIPLGDSDFELLFYMIPYTTKIRFGKNINEKILAYAMMVLDVLNHQGMSDTVKEIDFRSREIVYKHQGGGDI